MKFIVGKKIGMTQIFLDNGHVVPVTRVKAEPCRVISVQPGGREQFMIQVGCDEVPEWRLKKPQRGHVAGVAPLRNLKSFTVEGKPAAERGDTITVATFSPGDTVEVVGTSKGRGFAGVVKRHHFAGGPASHGHKDNLRAPGSIGAGGVQRVFKGMRMAGRMGGGRVTIKNLTVIEVHPETDELYIKGAVPGGRNNTLLISAEGELVVMRPAALAETEASSVPPVEVASNAPAPEVIETTVAEQQSQ